VARSGHEGGDGEALLDVNVLVALFDGNHTHHEAAHAWFADNRESGWATCPITENGFVRVISNVAYPGRRTTLRDAVDRLGIFRDSGGHVFWPDSLTLCDPARFRMEHIRGHGQITDAYLLALATSNGGRLASFDRRIVVDAVAGATPDNLTIIGDAGE